VRVRVFVWVFMGLYEGVKGNFKPTRAVTVTLHTWSEYVSEPVCVFVCECACVSMCGGMVKLCA